jgi:hypothetical protein
MFTKVLTHPHFLTFLSYWTWMSFFLSWSNLGGTDGETNERDLKPKSQTVYQHYQPLAGSIHVYR